VLYNQQSAFASRLFTYNYAAPSCARTNKNLIADLTVGITVFLVKN